MLTTEFESGESSSFQCLPELFLLVGLIATQQAGESFGSSPSP